MSRNRVGGKSKTGRNAQILATEIQNVDLTGASGVGGNATHNLVGSTHVVSGLDAGPPAQYLKALSPTIFGFGYIASDDLPGAETHDPVTVADTATVDLSLDGQEISADVLPGGIKLDDLGVPDASTDLDATVGVHGLLPALDDDDTHFLNGKGNWATPAGGTTGYNPDPPPDSPSSYDDEFGGTTLDEKWTPVNCAAGTVDLFAQDLTIGVYDLTMFPGNIALQPMQETGGNGMDETAAQIYQTIASLPTNCKFAAKAQLGGIPSSDAVVYCGIMISGEYGFADDNYIAVASKFIGAGVYTGTEVFGKVGGVPFSHVFALECPYLMLMKTDTAYRAFVSSNGKAWVDHAGTSWALGLMTNVLLTAFVYFGRPYYNAAPIGVFDFARYFEDNTPRAN